MNSLRRLDRSFTQAEGYPRVLVHSSSNSANKNLNIKLLGDFTNANLKDNRLGVLLLYSAVGKKGYYTNHLKDALSY